MIHQSDMDASQRLAFCRAGGREMNDRKLVVVPERMILSSEVVEAVAFHCGDGEDTSYGHYQDGILFIGVLKDDEGRDVYGLHIASGECEEEGYSTLVEFEKPLLNYDALAAQRDEGLAREAKLHSACSKEFADVEMLSNKVEALTKRLAEAEKLLRETWDFAPDDTDELNDRVQAFLASPGCADGEKP